MEDIKKEIEASRLQQIMTATEAEERWGLQPGTVRASCLRGPLSRYIEKGLVRKSGGTWLVTVQAMEKVYGKELGRVKIINEIERRDNFPVDGEAYVVGQAEDGRYYFAWGPDYPYAEELPDRDISAGESGISYHKTEAEAREAMRQAIEAWEN